MISTHNENFSKTFHLFSLFLMCFIALPSPNQANQSQPRVSNARSRSKSRSQSPVQRHSNDNQLHSASPSPERSSNNNNSNNNNNDDNTARLIGNIISEEQPQSSAPDSSSNSNVHNNNNTDTNNNNNNNNNNSQVDACTYFTTSDLRSVCSQYTDFVLPPTASRASLIRIIAKHMNPNKYSSISSFIADMLCDLGKHHSSSSSGASSSKSKSRRKHSSRSKSRSSSSSHHHRRSSKSNNDNNTNNNNDDMQLSSSKSSSSSSSKSNSTSHRHRSKSRSHSPQHRRHHHHSSSSRRSRSPSERRHHHSSSSSSSSSRRRHHHHSRSRSRDFSRSHSRDRSASPIRAALSVPDPLALLCKPIPTNQLKLLAEGTYIAMHKLIRPYVPSSNTEQVQVELGTGTDLFVLHTPKPKTRSIHTPLDWFEVMCSSVLPALTQRVLESTTHQDALALATTLQQHICYALHAVSLFRQYPDKFALVFKYLEAHRDACMRVTPHLNVAEPNAHLKQDMHQSIVAALSNSNSNQRSSTSNSNSSSTKTKKSSSSNNNTHKSKTSTNTHNDCGDFNSFKGCSRGTACKFAHTCRHCKAADHGKTSCVAFKNTTQDKNTKK